MLTGAVGQGLRQHTGVMACLEAQLGKLSAREVTRPWWGAVLEVSEGFLLISIADRSTSTAGWPLCGLPQHGSLGLDGFLYRFIKQGGSCMAFYVPASDATLSWSKQPQPAQTPGDGIRLPLLMGSWQRHIVEKHRCGSPWEMTPALRCS